MKKKNLVFVLVILSFCASGVRSESIIKSLLDNLQEVFSLVVGSPFPPLKPKDVGFYLFTKDPNVGERLEFDKESTITRSSFDPSKLTKFVTYGYADSVNGTFMRRFKSVLFRPGLYNYIEIDYDRCANRDFVSATQCIKEVGFFTGNLIKKLVELKNLKYEDVHLIGLSLGAHTVGFVSRSVGKRRVGRITAFDAGAQLFENQGPEERLDASDAIMVDAIHTGLDNFGIRRPVGTIDFYVNGGSQQPDCPQEDTFDNDCNHESSYLYFLETVPEKNRKKYIANQCESLEDALNAKCYGKEGIMGLSADLSPPGIYYIRVTERPVPEF